MTKEELIAQKLNVMQLRAQVIYHKYLYYVMADNVIPDGEYDELEQTLCHQAKQINWPRSWVGWNDIHLPPDKIYNGECPHDTRDGEYPKEGED